MNSTLYTATTFPLKLMILFLSLESINKNTQHTEGEIESEK